MKKVNLFIGTLSGGGAERAVSNISLNLDEEIKRDIILYSHNTKIDYPYSGRLIYLDEMKLSNPLKKILALITHLREIRKIKKRNPEVPTISFLEYPNLINALTRKSGKTIVSVRNHMSTKHNKGLKALFWNFTIKLLYSKTDQIVVVSQKIKRDLTVNYGISPDKINVIYNSYPIENIQELSEAPIEDKYKEIFNFPVIITSGRLNKQKGHWHLIRAFSGVKKKVIDAKLVFLGEGTLKEKLKELSKELGLDNDVHFLGFQENPFKYIKRSKIFVMSSLYEGFPNAIAEAMACGIPIVSTDCLSGPREILAPNEFGNESISYKIDEKRYGILMPVCDGNMYMAKKKLTKEEQEMANCMIMLLQDEELAKHFSNQSLKRIQDFNIKKIIKQWVELI